MTWVALIAGALALIATVRSWARADARRDTGAAQRASSDDDRAHRHAVRRDLRPLRASRPHRLDGVGLRERDDEDAREARRTDGFSGITDPAQRAALLQRFAYLRAVLAQEAVNVTLTVLSGGRHDARFSDG